MPQGDAETERWIHVLSSMRQYRGTDGKRAPYKPLLLLLLIGRLANGDDATVRFTDVEEELKALLKGYGVGSSTPRPEDPFVYLGSTPELWQVTDQTGLEIKGQHSKGFLREQATGTVSAEFVQALGDAATRDRIVNHLLEAEFPESLHEEILGKVGLFAHVRVQQPARNPHFRDEVLLAYEYRCSFCNFGARLMGEPVGIEAAHLRMHSKQGPSVMANGMALCVHHHRLFDRGALGLAAGRGERRILVSQHLDVVGDPALRPLLALAGEPMRPPQAGYEPPAEDHIDWHYENLFKQPARQ